MAPVVLEAAEATHGAVKPLVMATLSDPHTFLIPPENHADEMRGTNTVEPETKNGPDGNGKAADAKEAKATKKAQKTKKRDDNREDLLAALSDPRSYFEAQEKRSQQKKANESGMKDVHADGSAESTEATNASKKSSKTKKEAESEDDFLAALSDPRSYFAAQGKHAQQKKAAKKPDTESAGGAETVKKGSKSKKGTENVCVIM